MEKAVGRARLRGPAASMVVGLSERKDGVIRSAERLTLWAGQNIRVVIFWYYRSCSRLEVSLMFN